MSEPTRASDSARPPLTLAQPPQRRLFTPLPAPLSSFVGREREVALVVDRLRRADVRVVTLTGPGGIGKSRLAIRAAEIVSDDFVDGVCFVDLAPLPRADLVAATLARALGVRRHGDDDLADQLAAAIAARSVLLVLDTAEHVLDCVPVLARLLEACPHVKLLVTSRARLHLTGEHLLTVPPLSTSDTAQTRAHGRPTSDAERLFLARAQAVREDFAYTAENAGIVAEICRRVEGVPLAIELAAARTAHLPLGDLLTRLTTRFDLLNDGPRDAPARLRTMHDAIGWSYDLLSEGDRSLFRRLAVFANGFAADAVGSVTGYDGEALNGITTLLETSLLQRAIGPGGEPRFGMLETVRDFAWMEMEAHGEAADIRARHADWALALAEAGFQALVRARRVEPQWLDRLDAEQDNFRAALGWLEETGSTDAFARLAGFLGPFWFFRSHFSEGRFWLERALAAAPNSPPSVRGTVCASLGVLLQVMGEATRAESLVSEGRGLWEAGLELDLAAQAILMLGWIDVRAGRYRQAAERLTDAAERFGTLGASWWIAKTSFHRAEAALGERDLTSACAWFTDAHTRYLALGDAWGVASSLHGLGSVKAERNDFAGAAQLYLESFKAWDRLGNPEGVAAWLGGVAVLAALDHQSTIAAELMGAMAARCEATGQVLGLPERDRFEAAFATTRGSLGETAFANASGAGRAEKREQSLSRAQAFLTALIDHSSMAASSTANTAPYLTRRERDVLRLVSAGLTDREIAETLSISPRTVGVHVSHLLGKLGVETRRAARRRALDDHLV